MRKELWLAWLRPACALLGFAGIMVLAGCGGGSGAPNNPYAPVPQPPAPLQVLPGGQITVYPGTPTTLTVVGGVPPYRVFSSNTAVLPVTTAVSGDTIVLLANRVISPVGLELTVQDAVGNTAPIVSVTVPPAPLLSTGLTIRGNPNPNCPGSDNQICSGGTGTAQVTVTGATGASFQNRPIRWEVVQGNFSFVSNNPAQPLVQTLTTVTDGLGISTVILSVPVNTPTQTGIVRATDVTTGTNLTAPFVIQQINVNGDVLSVLPLGNTVITGPDATHCSSGVTLNYYIFGGTPPYTVQLGFPQALTLAGSPVLTNGGSFTVTTNGTCFTNATFVIRDSLGNVIPTGNYPTITNQVGTGATPPPLTPLLVTPGAISKNNCVPANTFQFIGTGGSAPYSAVITSSTSPTTPVISPQTGIAQGQAITVSNITSPASVTITLFDNSSPRQSGTVTIDCSGGPAPPTPPQLLVTPASYNFNTAVAGFTCVNQTANFTITGATPPYNVFFAPPRPGALITPPVVAASGQGFSVTGLTDGILTTNVTISDSSTPSVQVVVTITCPAALPPPLLTIAPGAYTYLGGQACSTSASVFTVTGGTPPYTVFFSTPGTQGVISPSSVAVAGGTFVVTGLASAPIPRSTSITIQDSSANPQFQTVLIDCREP